MRTKAQRDQESLYSIPKLFLKARKLKYLMRG